MPTADRKIYSLAKIFERPPAYVITLAVHILLLFVFSILIHIFSAFSIQIPQDLGCAVLDEDTRRMRE
jgi:hypothetical protein